MPITTSAFDPVNSLEKLSSYMISYYGHIWRFRVIIPLEVSAAYANSILYKRRHIAVKTFEPLLREYCSQKIGKMATYLLGSPNQPSQRNNARHDQINLIFKGFKLAAEFNFHQPFLMSSLTSCKMLLLLRVIRTWALNRIG